MSTPEVLSRIDALVKSNPVVLFMKGTPDFPQCGFSAAAAAVLQNLGVGFEGVNVLADPDVREGIKVYGNWPTIPQLYVGGELVGGADIIREMHASGELKTLIDEATA
jgi:monothiol glutaredoxin